MERRETWLWRVRFAAKVEGGVAGAGWGGRVRFAAKVEGGVAGAGLNWSCRGE